MAFRFQKLESSHTQGWSEELAEVYVRLIVWAFSKLKHSGRGWKENKGWFRKHVNWEKWITFYSKSMKVKWVSSVRIEVQDRK